MFSHQPPQSWLFINIDVLDIVKLWSHKICFLEPAVQQRRQ